MSVSGMMSKKCNYQTGSQSFPVWQHFQSNMWNDQTKCDIFPVWRHFPSKQWDYFKLAVLYFRYDFNSDRRNVTLKPEETHFPYISTFAGKNEIIKPEVNRADMTALPIKICDDQTRKTRYRYDSTSGKKSEIIKPEVVDVQKNATTDRNN